MTARASCTNWVIALALGGLLVVLGALQYRWLGQISDAERERTVARMQAAAGSFASDVNRELTRAVITFAHPAPVRPGDSDLAPRWARWKLEALVPDLVRAVFIARRDDSGHFSLSRLDRETGQLGATPWPPELRDIRARLERFPHPANPPAGPPRFDGPVVLAGDVPALVVPLLPPLRATRGFPVPPLVTGWTVVWLDLESIQAKFLPKLTARHFGGPRGVEYHVEVTLAAQPERVIFRAGPDVADAASSHRDIVAELFSLLPADGLRASDRPMPRTRPQWRLRVADPSRALDAAVARTQHRNLAIGFGVLVLLALTVAMMLVTTHRSRRLAQQQFEFITGVTHELKTPLAAMRSAAQNLADGLVRDHARVSMYGALIDREARRLGDRVDQLLEFAGMQSGRIALDREPVAIESVINEALAECHPALEEKAIRVEMDYTSLPSIIGDAAALRRALVNLLTNAIKYGADGGWIGIRARGVASSPPRVELTVEDRGAGIAEMDLPHIFDPFYRGRGRSAGSIPGSGLGLTLVRRIVDAHGGRVTVESHGSNGAAFTMHLPAES